MPDDSAPDRKYLSDDERKERRYAKKTKVHPPTASTAEIINAKDEMRTNASAASGQMSQAQDIENTFRKPDGEDE